MKRSYLENLVTIDREAFTALIRHLGFATAACYRLQNQTWTLVLSAVGAAESQAEENWPPAISDLFNYTLDTDEGLPLGWAKNVATSGTRSTWLKGVNFYFPEQHSFDLKLLIVTRNAAGKRIRAGELHAPLEVTASRIRGILLRAEKYAQVSEASFDQHIDALGADFRRLIDHELRTPMASVAGYAALLTELDPQQQQETWAEYKSIMQQHTEQALTMLDKLSLSLQRNSQQPTTSAVENIDAFSAAQEICDRMNIEVAQIIGTEAAARTSLRLLKATDQACHIRVNRKMFTWAIWEVLKNAVIHAKAGHVDISVYQSADRLVIDIADDGEGVALGSEELIFLRFYQDPTSLAARKGRRGLGLGLFLARRIAEQHLGQLIYTRIRGRSGVFRFIWPLLDAQELGGTAFGQERKGA